MKNQHEVEQFLYRQSELLEGLDRERNLTNHHRHAAALLEHVAAEARQVLDAE